MPGEKRWIILTPDGGQVSIGRHTDPSDDEIEAVAGKLRQAAIRGWLAVTEGDPDGTVPVSTQAGGSSTQENSPGVAAQAALSSRLSGGAPGRLTRSFPGCGRRRCARRTGAVRAALPCSGSPRTGSGWRMRSPAAGSAATAIRL
jgi:hypothetical protein